MNDDLAAHFERSAHSVRTYAASFEDSYAKPATRFSKEYPILTLFTLFMLCLSFVPVASFILFTFFLLVSLAISGFCFALVSVLFLFCCLIFALVVNTCLSACFTVAAVLIYLSLRLAFLVGSHGFGGISEWAAEVTGHIRDIGDKMKAASDRLSESSVVVIEHNDTSDSPVKLEQ